jgi:hypothetical protein
MVITDDESPACKEAMARADEAWKASRGCEHDADCETPYGRCASARGGRPRADLERLVLAAVTTCQGSLGVNVCDDETQPVCVEHRCRMRVVSKAAHLASHHGAVEAAYVIHHGVDFDAFVKARPPDFADVVVAESKPTWIVVVADVQLPYRPRWSRTPLVFVSVFKLADGRTVEKTWRQPDPDKWGFNRALFGLPADVVQADTRLLP